MSELNFVSSPEQLIQPKGAVIVPPFIEGEIMGEGVANFPVVQVDGHWAPFVDQPVEIQHTTVDNRDTYGCTGYSDNNQDQILHKQQYNEDIDISDRFVVVGDGTQPNVGNSMEAPAKFKKENGFLFENECPVTETIDEFYTKPTPEQFALAKTRLNIYASDYFFTGAAKPAALLHSLKISPVKVAVEGYYVFDENGRMKNTGYDYNHAVLLFDYVLNADDSVLEWWVRCSETKQDLKFRGDYQFSSPMIKSFKKKAMTKYKVAGKAAVFLLDPSSNSLVPFGDGETYKTFNGTVQYIDIVEVPTVEDLKKIAPFANVMLTEVPWDSSTFIQ